MGAGLATREGAAYASTFPAPCFFFLLVMHPLGQLGVAGPFPGQLQQLTSLCCSFSAIYLLLCFHPYKTALTLPVIRKPSEMGFGVCQSLIQTEAPITYDLGQPTLPG